MTKIVETNSVLMHHGARESRRVSDILIPPYETTCNIPYHGLRTPNEGINQINLKIGAYVADKICFGRT